MRVWLSSGWREVRAAAPPAKGRKRSRDVRTWPQLGSPSIHPSTRPSKGGCLNPPQTNRVCPISGLGTLGRPLAAHGPVLLGPESPRRRFGEADWRQQAESRQRVLVSLPLLACCAAPGHHPNTQAERGPSNHGTTSTQGLASGRWRSDLHVCNPLELQAKRAPRN